MIHMNNLIGMHHIHLMQSMSTTITYKKNYAPDLEYHESGFQLRDLRQ